MTNLIEGNPRLLPQLLLDADWPRFENIELPPSRTLQGYEEVFGKALQPITEGLVELTKADPTSRYITGFRGYRHGFPSHENGLTFGFSNRWFGRNSHDLPHIRVFGPHGKLGLIAVTLQARLSDPSEMELGLVLPTWTTEPLTKPLGHNVLLFEPEGQVYCYPFRPAQPSGNLYAECGLGFRDYDALAVDYVRNSGTYDCDAIEELIGFPDVLGYLAKVLPQLHEYLKAMAAMWIADLPK